MGNGDLYVVMQLLSSIFSYRFVVHVTISSACILWRISLRVSQLEHNVSWLCLHFFGSQNRKDRWMQTGYNDQGKCCFPFDGDLSTLFWDATFPVEAFRELSGTGSYLHQHFLVRCKEFRCDASWISRTLYNGDLLIGWYDVSS